MRQVIWLSLVGVLLSVSLVYAGGVTDNNNGILGQVLVSTGENNGTNSVGHWTDASFLKGDTGAQGVAGQDGYTPIKGVDYFDGKDGINGIDGVNGIDGKDGYTPIKGIDYSDGQDGLNGKDGKDGAKGDKGDKGDKGNDGTDGLDGDKGDKGDNGKDVDPKTVDELKDSDTKINNEILNQNNKIDNISNRVSKLEKTQFMVRTELKFIREKHLEVGIYNAYSFTRNACTEVGINVVIPIGNSYLDRENKRINARLDRLDKQLGNSAIITRTVSSKGKLTSIEITNGQVVTNGKF
jgi:hypothetical protein